MSAPSPQNEVDPNVALPILGDSISLFKGDSTIVKLTRPRVVFVHSYASCEPKDVRPEGYFAHKGYFAHDADAGRGLYEPSGYENWRTCHRVYPQFSSNQPHAPLLGGDSKDVGRTSSRIG